MGHSGLYTVVFMLVVWSYWITDRVAGLEQKLRQREAEGDSVESLDT